jgi:hypothetical protein
MAKPAPNMPRLTTVDPDGKPVTKSYSAVSPTSMRQLAIDYAAASLDVQRGVLIFAIQSQGGRPVAWCGWGPGDAEVAA